MTTKRTPINRTAKPKITPEMVNLFRRMEDLRGKCACETGECPTCEQWWPLNWALQREMGLSPWNFPAYSNPLAIAVYPKAYYSADHDQEAVTRYHVLQTTASAGAAHAF